MRVLLDTNVIISAFAARSLSADVFELCISHHTVITSDHILSEVREKLIDKIALPAVFAEEIISYLRQNAIVTASQVAFDADCRDEDDLSILGAAAAGHADCIVTGDNDLLVLGQYKGIRIMTPRQFWEFIRSGRRS